MLKKCTCCVMYGILQLTYKTVLLSNKLTFGDMIAILLMYTGVPIMQMSVFRGHTKNCTQLHTTAHNCIQLHTTFK